MANRLQLLLASDFHNLGSALQEEVYYEYYNMVHGLIVYIIKERAAAEDIIQEAFIKIIKNKPIFEDEVKLKAWLKVVTRNTAINYLRKIKITVTNWIRIVFYRYGDDESDGSFRGKHGRNADDGRVH